MIEAPSELLRFLDVKLNDLMIGLYRSRQALTMLQDRAESDASLIAMVGMALAAVRQQERALADIQQRLDQMRPTTTSIHLNDANRSR